jgi:hypothetical protein
MDSKIEQRVCIKFWVKLGKSTTKTLEMLREAFGEYSLSQAAGFEWHSRFKAGRVSVEDERSGSPSTSKTKKMLKKFENSSTKTIAEQSMSSQTPLGWISYGVFQEILTENLNMHHTAAKFVPCLLTKDQKQWHVNVCVS